MLCKKLHNNLYYIKNIKKYYNSLYQSVSKISYNFLKNKRTAMRTAVRLPSFDYSQRLVGEN